jgi:acetophenone carboxylase
MASDMIGTATREVVTEYLEIDVKTERWHCRRCDQNIGDARQNYKRGLLLFDRDPSDIHESIITGEYTYAPDPEWCRIVEFYCPGCAAQLEVEYLPPGHPITHDIEIDVDWLKTRNERRNVEQGA